MKTLLVIGVVGLLAACGAEGDPLRLRANLGVNIGTNGVSQSVAVGASNSNVNLSLGLGG